MTEVLLLNITLVHDMILINETLDRIVLRIDHTDHLTDAILVLDTDHVLIQEITLLPDVFLHLDLRQNQEILQIPSPALTLTQETKLIVYKLNKKKTYVSPYRNGQCLNTNKLVVLIILTHTHQ